jgi:hypothetical protein
MILEWLFQPSFCGWWFQFFFITGDGPQRPIPFFWQGMAQPSTSFHIIGEPWLDTLDL